MKLYLDNKNEIMAVNSTDRTDLTEITVDDNEFMGWSDVRICCYRINYYYPQIETKTQTNEETGETIEVPVYSEYATITMMTPYVPTHIIAAMKQLDEQHTETEQGMTEMDLRIIESEQYMTDLELMMLEG